MPRRTASIRAARESTSPARSRRPGTALSRSPRWAARRALSSPGSSATWASRQPAAPIAGNTRINVTLVEPDGTLTKVNAAGPELSPAEAEDVLEAVRVHSSAADWIACCGSLPRGLPPQWYAELVERSHRVRRADRSGHLGAALTAALDRGPDVIKPNAQELAEAVGLPLTTVGDALKAAEELRGRGARSVLASLGADGQLLVEASGAYFATAPVTAVRSNVGAGDASLAGFLAAGGQGPEALASAVAHGAAAAAGRKPHAHPGRPRSAVGRDDLRRAAGQHAGGTRPMTPVPPSPPRPPVRTPPVRARRPVPPSRRTAVPEQGAPR